MMKKLFLFSALSLGTISLISCVERDTYTNIKDNDTIGSVIDVTANFTNNNEYTATFKADRAIPTSDMILVYKGGEQGFWKLVPLTQNIDQQGNTVSYESHFNTSLVKIEAFSNLPLDHPALTSYLINQRFRILIVPANYLNKGKQEVDYSNYNEVIKYFNIDESKVVTL